ncbi:MAG: carboxylating nicotinate-nucleotide diphosphorylase [Pseudomonadales bacterium]
MDNDYLQGLAETVAIALDEDIGSGDITARLILANTRATAEVITRDAAVLCGQPWVDEVFRQVDPDLLSTWFVNDSERADPGTTLFRVSGAARSILTAERTALNFLQTLSGTATRTRHYADLIKHTGTYLLDTRKTLPGLRKAQKYAVNCGGAKNHRMGLYDAFLIKENHIIASGSIAGAINSARSIAPDKRVEIEVENLDEFRQAVDAAPDWIMLDNFSLADLRTAVNAINDTIKLEASGGIESDQDLLAIAETGVHYISVGALTKHCDAIDLSMRIIEQP